jgi:3,4-dihydroxy 2-butanone 4-phosphate synthase / GTP cyclohydrolase II
VGAPRLFTRMHSSCVTSETMRACDCDCSAQLDAAFQVIVREKHGILFYLLQEGRGVGYLCKSRDRMLVQASRDAISTFDAYKAMSLRHDHRDYSNISHICHLLGVKAPFVLLTNNPDKILAMKKLGVSFVGTMVRVTV